MIINLQTCTIFAMQKEKQLQLKPHIQEMINQQLFYSVYFPIYTPHQVKKFLEMGADPNVKYQGDFPLIKACSGGDIEKIKLLLEYGARVNVRNAHGETPLYNCIVNKNYKVMQLLLKNGADPHLVKTWPFSHTTPLKKAIHLVRDHLVNQLLVAGVCVKGWQGYFNEFEYSCGCVISSVGDSILKWHKRLDIAKEILFNGAIKKTQVKAGKISSLCSLVVNFINENPRIFKVVGLNKISCNQETQQVSTEVFYKIIGRRISLWEVPDMVLFLQEKIKNHTGSDELEDISHMVRRFSMKNNIAILHALAQSLTIQEKNQIMYPSDSYELGSNYTLLNTIQIFLERLLKKRSAIAEELIQGRIHGNPIFLYGRHSQIPDLKIAFDEKDVEIRCRTLTYEEVFL